MNANVEILKKMIENLTPELLDKFTHAVENFGFTGKVSIPQFQMEEVMERLNFHRQHPNTRLDFLENIKDLEKSFAW